MKRWKPNFTDKVLKRSWAPDGPSTLSSPGTYSSSSSSSSSLGDALLLSGLFGGGLAERGGGTTTRQLALLLLLLPEGEQLGVVVGVGLGFSDTRAFKRFDATRTLQHDGRDETLNLGRLGLGRLLAFFQLQGASHDVLTNIVVFVQVEQLADLAGSLGTQATRNRGVGQTWNIGFALLDDDEVENGEIGVDDAASDASAVTLTRASRTIAFVLSAQKQTNSTVGQHSLHHGETLFIVATADPEDVSLPFVTQRVAGNLLRHLLVEKDAKFAVILNLDEFLTPGGRVGDVQLHCYGF